MNLREPSAPVSVAAFVASVESVPVFTPTSRLARLIDARIESAQRTRHPEVVAALKALRKLYAAEP